MKQAKERYNLAKDITPQAARNFLKMLDKNCKVPSVAESPEKSKKACVYTKSTTKIPVNKSVTDKFTQNNDKIAVINNLETKLATMTAKMEQLNQKTSKLKEQVSGLNTVIKLLTQENNTLKQVNKPIKD